MVQNLDMDPRDKGIVKQAHTVGREEQDPVKVLKRAKEACTIGKIEAASSPMQPDSPATRPFRWMSVLVRRSMNTSASSISRIAPHLLARLKWVVRFLSVSDAMVPMSLLVSTISGLLVYPEIHSAYQGEHSAAF